jgi:OmpA-OmpF porin, OOP family
VLSTLETKKPKRKARGRGAVNAKQWVALVIGCCLAASPAVGDIPNRWVVLFDHGSAKLTEAFQATVVVNAVASEAKEALSHTDAIVVYVSGYADRSGPADFNMHLSRRRAEAVADALVAAGIARKYLEVSWHGEEELPVPTPDGVREQANRVVLMSIWGRK